MSMQQSSIEVFNFSSTDGLVLFLKDEWSYDDKDVDQLLTERYEHDCYADAHEKTVTEISLSQRDGEWFLSLKKNSNLFDNY